MLNTFAVLAVLAGCLFVAWWGQCVVVVLVVSQFIPAVIISVGP